MSQRRTTPLRLPIMDAHVCTPAVRRQILGRVSLFAGLKPEELIEVDRRCRAHGFEAGEQIYHQGSPASQIFVVATGAAKTVRPTAEGRETLLDLCAPGDFLGAVPALGQEVYAEDAYAITGSCLLGLSQSDYEAIMAEFPSVALATLKGVSQRLSAAQEAVHLLAGASLEERLAATLLLLADKFGRDWQGGVLIQVPLTRVDLAAMTGAATESVSRLLSGWRRAGLIESGRRWIAVLDPAGLTAFRDQNTR